MKVFLVALTMMISFATSAAEEILVPGGIYRPFFRDKNEIDQNIGPLFVDKFPVTNKDFLGFVKSHPQWQKSKIKRIFSDPQYLEHWASDLSFPKKIQNYPVVNVSWFAARKFCESKGKRLATIAEWEYVSDAQNPKNLDLVLNWYGKTGDHLQAVSSAPANVYGIVGIHGLIWEWVEDFSSSIMAGDSRSSNETSKSMFCGSGSLKAKDPTQYATFMRFAHRSSLQAKSVGRNLGFRCVRDSK